MSKKIKRVWMNGVELVLSGGWWMTKAGAMGVHDANLNKTVAAGLITVEYEPEMVRCDHWGAPWCIGKECRDYEAHAPTKECAEDRCYNSDSKVKCIPNAPGWAATHPDKCEHGNDPATCWKCDMTQVWRDGELEFLNTNGIWEAWKPSGIDRPVFNLPFTHYRRRPKPVAPEVEDMPYVTPEDWLKHCEQRIKHLEKQVAVLLAKEAK